MRVKLLLAGGDFVRFLNDESKMKYKILTVVCVIIIFLLILSTLFDDLRNEECIGKEKVHAAYRSFLTTSLVYSVIGFLCIVVFSKIIIHGFVPSESMVPNLNVGDHLLINGTAYWFSDVERGDIVVFENTEINETLVKRCIGLPGDTVTFEDGDVYINGEKLDESAYLDGRIHTYSMRSFQVPEDCYFFLGDNRYVSNDARYWANSYIPKEDLVGKVIKNFSFKENKGEPVILNW